MKVMIETSTISTRIIDIPDAEYKELQRRNFNPNTEAGRAEMDEYLALRKQIVARALKHSPESSGTEHEIQDLYGNKIGWD